MNKISAILKNQDIVSKLVVLVDAVISIKSISSISASHDLRIYESMFLSILEENYCLSKINTDNFL